MWLSEPWSRSRSHFHGKVSLILGHMETCSNCKLELSEPARLLPCLHSSCYRCLQSQIINPEAFAEICDGRDLPDKGRVSCPVCGVEVDLPSGGVQHLPLDPRAQESLIQRCQLCTVTPTLAFCKCEECVLFMCALCAETHIKFGDIGAHSIVHLKETRVRNSPSDQTWCSRHISEKTAFFCWDCRCAVCSLCCAGHHLEDIPSAAAKLTTFLTESVTVANTALKHISVASNSAYSLTSAINDRCDAIKKEVEEFIEGYKLAIENHRFSLLAQIEQVRESRSDIAKDSMNHIDHWMSTTNHILQFAAFLSSTASHNQVVNIGPWALERLQEVSNSSNILRQPNVSSWVQFLPEEKPTSSTKYLLTGIISTQAVSPSHSSLEVIGILNCRQHTKSVFVLKTRDSENKLLTHGGEKILAEVKYNDASQRMLPADVSDEGDGNYTITFVPDAFGTLLLSIFVHNKHVKGSPYTVAVSSTRQHKGIYHCCAFCSSGGNKNAICACGSKMPGGYRGCGHGHEGHPGRRHWSCCASVLQSSECGRPIEHQFSF